MAGLCLFNQRSVWPLAPRDLLGSAYVICASLCLIYANFFLCFNRKKPQGSFTYLRPGLHRKKNFFGPPSGAKVAPSFTRKPSQKHQDLTPIGWRSRSQFFLCLMQHLKAVAMGMATAIKLLRWGSWVSHYRDLKSPHVTAQLVVAAVARAL